MNKSRVKKKEKPDLEFQVTPSSRDGELGTGEFHKISKRDVGVGVGLAEDATDNSTTQFEETREASVFANPPANVVAPDEEIPNPYAANGLSADWDCVAQGLTSGGWGMDSYSMGSSQDSAYEYFPKVRHSTACPSFCRASVR